MGNTQITDAVSGNKLKVNSDGSVISSLGTLAVPNITEDNIRNGIRNGQGFIANGRGLTATNANLLNCALSIFNPGASGKTLLVFALRGLVSTNGGTLSQWNLTTTAPSGTGFTGTVTPVQLPGATSPASVASCVQTPTGNTTTVGAPGTKAEEFLPPSAQEYDILAPGSIIALPPGNGLAVMLLVGTTGGYFQACAKWIEI